MIKFILHTLLLLAYATSAQQIQLKGSVAVHNSKYSTGKVAYVKDAFVTAPFTRPAAIDNKGVFALEFVGLGAGTSIALQLEKEGLEVVNTHDLEDVVISRKLPVRIYVAKKGELAKAQTELYNISKEALFAKRDALIVRLRADNAQSKATITELEQQFGQQLVNRFEAEDLLRDKIAAHHQQTTNHKPETLNLKPLRS